MIKLPIHPGHTYTELVVVMEGCSKSLDEFIKDPSNLGGYNPSTVLTTILPLAVDVCKGLCVLHDKRYVHGDLTAATVLVYNKHVFKIKFNRIIWLSFMFLANRSSHWNKRSSNSRKSCYCSL